jgi:hypothetical protein
MGECPMRCMAQVSVVLATAQRLLHDTLRTSQPLAG